MKNPLWLPIALFATVISGVQSFGELEAPSLKWGGFASLREGQIVKGEKEATLEKKANYNHVWVQEMIIGLSLQSQFKNFPAVGNISAEIAVNNDNVPHEEDWGTSRRLNFYPYLSRADLLFTIADNENVSATLDIGYFPYKYNSSVRNLGEYLFRSGTYPQYILTEVDFPMARLMGLKFGGSLHKIFNFDILLTTNIEWTAIGDVNLSGIFSFKPIPLFELGIGGCWNSIISTDIDKTTPLASGSEYLIFDKNTGDSARCNYTFAGQKVMGRLTLDIKHLFRGVDVFGEEDLKLYTEAAILGVINYPLSRDGYTRYDNILERIPVMAGFNFPTFKLLDVLSAEVEWYNNPYPNSTNSIRFDNEPTPLSASARQKVMANTNIHDDDWKWSVYLKKTVFNNLSIMCQVARDHIRWYRLDYVKADGTEALRKNNEWYYTFKFGYAF
jgi:hypothetical protein